MELHQFSINICEMLAVIYNVTHHFFVIIFTVTCIQIHDIHPFKFINIHTLCIPIHTIYTTSTFHGMSASITPPFSLLSRQILQNIFWNKDIKCTSFFQCGPVEHSIQRIPSLNKHPVPSQNKPSHIVLSSPKFCPVEPNPPSPRSVSSNFCNIKCCMILWRL